METKGECGNIDVSVHEIGSAGYIRLTNDKRVSNLNQFYYREYGEHPQFIVRVPGRVNIIGEHVDYCGYPVLPMAIGQSILLAVGFNQSNSFLQLRNVENEKFENFKCDLNEIEIKLPESGGPEWYKYYLCGVKGIHETLSKNTLSLSNNTSDIIGMTVALSGNIPPASGLSSSSALVSAAVLATAHVHRLPLQRKQLASISANCERYIGTQGGGMDQAIAYLARAGCAQFIEFYPELNSTSVQLPNGACFVVANSLAKMNKAATAHFNERVMECRLSARLIAKRKGLLNWLDIIRFAQLQDALNCTLCELESLAKQYLNKEIYTRKEICNELAVSDEQLSHDFLTPNTSHMNLFKLRQRTLHVLQESLRVNEFRMTCHRLASDKHTNGNCSNGHAGDGLHRNRADDHHTDLQKLSQLMRKSHESLNTLYECSHPDLNRIIAIADDLGIGCRLTGAGWGGSVVALCETEQLSKEFMQTLKDRYYSQLPVSLVEQYLINDLTDVVFTTTPCHGAEICLL